MKTHEKRSEDGATKGQQIILEPKAIQRESQEIALLPSGTSATAQQRPHNGPEIGLPLQQIQNEPLLERPVLQVQVQHGSEISNHTQQIENGPERQYCNYQSCS